MRVGDRLISGRPQGFGFLSIGGGEAFLPAGQAIFDVEDAGALVEAVTMFRKHLHSVRGAGKPLKG